MRSVSNIFKLSAEDPVSSHITKYTMNMKPSAFSDTRSKTCVKYNCFIVCKEMRQSFYLLKVNMLWESGSVTKSNVESEVLGSFTNTYEFKRPLAFKRYQHIIQNLAFEVTDTKSKKVLGVARYSYKPSQAAKDFLVTIPIISKETETQTGTLQVVFARADIVTRDYVGIEIIGKDLKNVDENRDKGDKSDPFLVFLRKVNDETYVPIHCTEAIMDNLNPRWEKVILSLDELCNHELTQTIKIECWDWQEDLCYQFIGDTETTMNELYTKPFLTLHSRNPRGKTGELRVKACKKLIKPSPTDYLTTEDKFAFVLGIDFSVYNDYPHNIKNLHTIDKKGRSPYLQALQEISKVIWGQDTDGKIPCFGFGGRPSFPEYSTEQVNHLIPISGNKHKMSILSPDHLIESYKNARKYIDPMEKASVLEIMKLVKDWATRDLKANIYYVMVVLTAGHIDELQPTIDLLVDLAQLPVSIVLVGIGDYNFSTLEKLDGDKKWLRSSKKKLIKRDIINFVDFETCANDPEKLLKKVLEEFPGQFMSFKTRSGYKVDGDTKKDLTTTLNTEPR